MDYFLRFITEIGSRPFDDIANPLIVLGEACFAVAMLLACFKVRYMPMPIPQLFLSLTGNLGANLFARAGEQAWFFYTDVAMFWLAPATVLSILLYMREHEGPLRLLLDKQYATRKPDLVSRYQRQIAWAMSLVIVGIVIYHYLEQYTSKRELADQSNMAKAEGMVEGRRQADSLYALFVVRLDSAYRVRENKLVVQMDSLIDEVKKATREQMEGIALEHRNTRHTILIQAGMNRSAIGEVIQNMTPLSTSLSPPPSPPPVTPMSPKKEPSFLERIFKRKPKGGESTEESYLHSVGSDSSFVSSSRP